MNRTPSPAPNTWRRESAQSWQAMERQAAAQAREYHRRSVSQEPLTPPAPAAPAPEPPAPPEPAGARRKLLGRFSSDQLLLAALLCLLVQEEADPSLILAVAYILLA